MASSGYCHTDYVRESLEMESSDSDSTASWHLYRDPSPEIDEDELVIPLPRRYKPPKPKKEKKKRKSKEEKFLLQYVPSKWGRLQRHFVIRAEEEPDLKKFLDSFGRSELCQFMMKFSPTPRANNTTFGFSEATEAPKESLGNFDDPNPLRDEDRPIFGSGITVEKIESRINLYTDNLETLYATFSSLERLLHAKPPGEPDLIVALAQQTHIFHSKLDAMIDLINAMPKHYMLDEFLDELVNNGIPAVEMFISMVLDLAAETEKMSWKLRIQADSPCPPMREWVVHRPSKVTPPTERKSVPLELAHAALTGPAKRKYKFPGIRTPLPKVDEQKQRLMRVASPDPRISISPQLLKPKAVRVAAYSTYAEEPYEIQDEKSTHEVIVGTAITSRSSPDPQNLQNAITNKTGKLSQHNASEFDMLDGISQPKPAQALSVHNAGVPIASDTHSRTYGGGPTSIPMPMPIRATSGAVSGDSMPRVSLDDISQPKAALALAGYKSHAPFTHGVSAHPNACTMVKPTPVRTVASHISSASETMPHDSLDDISQPEPTRAFTDYKSLAPIEPSTNFYHSSEMVMPIPIRAVAGYASPIPTPQMAHQANDIDTIMNMRPESVHHDAHVAFAPTSTLLKPNPMRVTSDYGSSTAQQDAIESPIQAITTSTPQETTYDFAKVPSPRKVISGPPNPYPSLATRVAANPAATAMRAKCGSVPLVFNQGDDGDRQSKVTHKKDTPESQPVSTLKGGSASSLKTKSKVNEAYAKSKVKETKAKSKDNEVSLRKDAFEAITSSLMDALGEARETTKNEEKGDQTSPANTVSTNEESGEGNGNKDARPRGGSNSSTRSAFVRAAARSCDPSPDNSKV